MVNFSVIASQPPPLLHSDSADIVCQHADQQNNHISLFAKTVSRPIAQNSSTEFTPTSTIYSIFV